MENSTVLTPQFPDFGALLESVRENGRRIQESAERYYKEQAERDAKWKAEQAERDEKWKAEQAERDEKWKAEQAERDAKWKTEHAEHEAEREARMERISRENKKAIREMKNVFTTEWGRLIEALCKPAAFKLFKKEGVEIDRIYEGIHKAKEDGQDVMEIDIALCDTSVAVIVEVKTRCGKRDIDYVLSQMEHCKEYYKEFADKKLLVAVAAISYDTGAVKYAHRKGVYVLKLTGEETFTLSAPDNPIAF